jgi:hypothetical protein
VVIGDVIPDSKYAKMKVGELWKKIVDKSKPVAVSDATTTAILEGFDGEFVFLGCGTGAGMRPCDLGYDINKYMIEIAQEKGLNVEKADFMEIDLSGFKRICVPYVLQGLGEEERKELYGKLQHAEYVVFTVPSSYKKLAKEINWNFLDHEVKLVKVPVDFSYGEDISRSVGVGIIAGRRDLPTEFVYGSYVEGEEFENTIYTFRGLLKSIPVEYREKAIELLNDIVNKKISIFKKDGQLVTPNRVLELVGSDIVELVKAYVTDKRYSGSERPVACIL